MFFNLSRRQFLNLIRVVSIGTVTTASVPLLGNLLASKAQAQNIYEFVYKGRNCRVATNQIQERTTSTDLGFDTSKQLFIDNQEIKIAQNKQNQKYMTPLLFGDFDSPQEVAKMLIDLGIKFPNGEVQLDPDIN